jgi:plastocyanin
MNKTIVAIAAVIILGVGGALAFTLSNNNQTAVNEISRDTAERSADGQEHGSEAETSTESSTEMAAAVTIIYNNDGFEPTTYKISAGQKIAVRNDSTRTLDFASDDHPAHRDNSELNIGVIRPGQTEEFTISKTGEWGFHNHDFAAHEGSITVE